MSEASHIQALTRATPRVIRRHAERALSRQRTPFIQSSPGMGKSSIVKDIAKEFDLVLLDERLSTKSPVDITGLPEFYTDAAGVRRARFSPFENFPVVGTPKPKGSNGWLLFLDEFNSAALETQAAAYQLVLDRQVGAYKLHSDCYVVAAGNLATDRAIVNDLSTAMQSRVVHLEMILSFDDWLQDVALPKAYDHRMVGYLSQEREAALMDFKPDHTNKTFCCPRTWEFMNDFIGEDAYDANGAPVLDKQKRQVRNPLPIVQDDIALYAGTITPGRAVDFVNWVKVFAELIQTAEILRDPLGCRIPTEPNLRWALVSRLMTEIDAKNFKDISAYINRFTMEYRVLFFRAVLAQQPALRTHPDFARAAIELDKYLNR